MPVGNNRVIGQTKIKLTTLSVSNMVCPHFAECYLSPVQSCKEPSPHLGHSPTLSSGHCPYISGVAYTVDLFSPMHIVSFSLDRPICFNLVLLQVRDEVLQYVDVDVYMNYRSNVNLRREPREGIYKENTDLLANLHHQLMSKGHMYITVVQVPCQGSRLAVHIHLVPRIERTLKHTWANETW